MADVDRSVLRNVIDVQVQYRNAMSESVEWKSKINRPTDSLPYCVQHSSLSNSVLRRTASRDHGHLFPASM